MKLRRSTLRLLAGALFAGPALSLIVHADENSGAAQDSASLLPLESSREVVGTLEFRPKSLFEQLENLLDDDPAPKPPADLFKRDSEKASANSVTTPKSTSKQEAGDDAAVPVESSDMEMRTDTSSDETERVADVHGMRTPFDNPSDKPTVSGDIPTTLAPAESDIVVAPAPELTNKTDEPSTEAVSQDLDEIQLRIDLCLAQHYMNPENPATRSSWGIMHSMLSYGADTRLIANGRRFNAVGWLCYNQPCRGQKMMERDGNELELKLGPGFQGHEGQFLAMLAQIGIPRTQTLQVDKRNFTVSDLVRHEMSTCVEKTELTFKLIGLTQYLPTTARWRDNRGRYWDFEKLLAEELAQPIVGAACGGTHRLMGFSFALAKRAQENQPVSGEWLRARNYIDSYIEYTLSLQNPDGSFSTEWFERRGANPSIDRRFQTTGHILEWLVYSLPPERLKDEPIVRAVDYLSQIMWENRDKKWEVGPKGHALRALALYNDRVFGIKMGDGGVRLTKIASEHGIRRGLR